MKNKQSLTAQARAMVKAGHTPYAAAKHFKIHPSNLYQKPNRPAVHRLALESLLKASELALPYINNLIAYDSLETAIDKAALTLKDKL